MPIEVLLVQLLVLVFTGALWWIARRDLAARVPPPAPPNQAADMAELEQLCATLETLATSLARRLDRVEAAQREMLLEVPREAVQREAAQTQFAAFSPGSVAMPEPPVREPTTERPAEPEPVPRYLQVYALLDRGVSDPIEIARQTGLGRGEVDLILSLRGRRAL